MLKLPEMLKLAPATIGAAYAVAIVFSVICDFVYFQALNIHFREAPISLGDHIRSSVIWFPPVSLTAIFLIFVLRKIEKIEKAYEPISQWWKPRWKLAGHGALYLVSWIIISIGIAHWTLKFNLSLLEQIEILIESFKTLQYVSIAFLVVLLIATILIRSTRSYSPIFGFWIFFGLFFTVFIINIWNDSQILTDCSKRSKYTLTLASGKEIPNVVLARSFESYFLIRNCESDELKFIKADRFTGFTGSHWK